MSLSHYGAAAGTAGGAPLTPHHRLRPASTPEEEHYQSQPQTDPTTTYDSLNSKVESDLSWVPVGVLAGLE